jgi:hypothetical protein
MTEPIRAEISESNQCDAQGHTVKTSAPVLAMCRKLVEAGFDPATPLHAYRGGTLCLKVSSICWGALAVPWAITGSGLPCSNAVGIRLKVLFRPRP